MAETKRILIVDDDAELGELLAKAVGDMSEHYVVQVARDVDQAMVQVRDSQTANIRFDLVITDIKMSGLSGLELLEALNSIAPHTPTIAMTAYNSSDIAERAKELNVAAYLTKPFVISEFRQIVRSTLEPSDETNKPHTAMPSGQLTSEQKVAITRLLGTLRAMIGAEATLLTHSSGTIVAADSIEQYTHLDQFGAELEAMQRTMSKQMRATFGSDGAIKQSYFSTDALGVCIYRLDDRYAAAVVFSHTVKEGQVWYYLREASTSIQATLVAEQPQVRKRRSIQSDVFEMMQEFFPDQKETPEQQPAPPLEPAAPETTKPVSQAPIDDSALDAIDWNATPDDDWEALVQDEIQSFQGLSFEQAQSQGLLAEDLAETKAPERPPVDEIDWDVEANLDWDAIVDETDQGLGGLSFEDAQKRGLIDDLSE